MQQKLVPEVFIILVNNPKQLLHARNYFKSKIFGKRLSKSLQKVTFFVLSSPVPFNRQNYQKQKGPGIETSGYSGFEISSEKFLH